MHDDDADWNRLDDNFMVRPIESRERLMDQISLFLHRSTEALPAAHRRMLEDLYLSNLVLAGKKVLIVDDDIRNIFALSSVLEEQGMTIASAENGRDAIKLLQRTIGHRRRADGHDDAGDGRYRYDAPGPPIEAVRICRLSRSPRRR